MESHEWPVGRGFKPYVEGTTTVTIALNHLQVLGMILQVVGNSVFSGGPKSSSSHSFGDGKA